MENEIEFYVTKYFGDNGIPLKLKNGISTVTIKTLDELTEAVNTWIQRDNT